MQTVAKHDASARLNVIEADRTCKRFRVAHERLIVNVQYLSQVLQSLTLKLALS